MKNNFDKVLSFKNVTDNSADLYFYGDIVSDSWYAWQDEDQWPEQVKNLLVGKEGKKLNIYINSCGGSVFAGIAIYNIIKRHTGYKTVYIDGIAASIASVIAFAGDKVVIPSNAFLMIHKPWTNTDGNANDLRKIADTLDVLETSIIDVYKQNLKDGVDIETIKQFVNDETWLTGEQAAEYFNVEVSSAKQMVACVDAAKFKNAPTNLIIKAENSHEDITAAKLKTTAARIKSLCISGITKGA